MAKGTQTSSSEMLASVLHRNVQALLEHRQEELRRRTTQEKFADGVTKFAGSLASIYIHAILFGTWIVWNLPWLSFPKFDPTYVMLAIFASVEATFLSTFVLISQNRMSTMGDKRADLDLQVSLLAEHEITQLLHLVTAIAEHLGLEEAQKPELQELKLDIAPAAVLETIEKTNRDAGA